MASVQTSNSTIDKLCQLCNFLHLDSKPIINAEYTEKCITDINAFLIDAYNLKKLIQKMSNENDPDMLKDPHSDPVEKFKLLVDLVELWNNPKILTLIDQLKQDRLSELEKDADIEKFCRKINDTCNKSQPNKVDLVSTVNSNIHLSKDYDDDIGSDVSNDEFMADEVTKLIDTGYYEIENNSVLQQMYKIERYNHCNMVNNDKEELEGSEKSEDIDCDNSEGSF
jgi:hypothetical protein